MSASANLGANVPTDILEMRAAEQRRRIHASVLELREQIDEKLDVKKRAAEYVLPASGAAAFLGLLFGYGFASMFSRPRS
ncbi:MAG: hypothetical protein ACXVZR_01830 [Terriglobales bacterium]|jgi:hypothetical protein